MTTKRCLLFVGLLIAVAFLGVYAARATSALASETTVEATDASLTSPGNEVAGPAVQDEGVCRSEGGGATGTGPSPDASCSNCTSDEECVALGCGGGCDPVVCVQFGFGKRCMCQ
jgi:hypothetical protein